MERISILLEKIKTLNSKQNISAIDIDLMMDYVKVVYADLMDLRTQIDTKEEVNNSQTTSSQIANTPQNDVGETSSENSFIINDEPTLEEMTQALENELNDDELEIAPSPIPENPTNNIAHQPLDTNNHTNTTQKEQPEKLEKIDTTPVSFPTPKEDIRKFIGINEKFVFINELFQNNREAYEEVLKELSDFSNTEDAVKWLTNTVAQPYNWTEDDFNVQDFYRVLDSYYRRKSN